MTGLDGGDLFKMKKKHNYFYGLLKIYYANLKLAARDASNSTRKYEISGGGDSEILMNLKNARSFSNMNWN